MLDWIHKFDNSIQSSDSWFEVSAKEIANYWTCEGDLLLNWKHHGYKTLFDLLSVRVIYINHNYNDARYCIKYIVCPIISSAKGLKSKEYVAHNGKD